MRRLKRSILLFAAAAIAAIPAAAAERAEVPEKYRWNTADIFPSDEAWQQARADVARRIPGLERFKGTLGQSPGALYDAVTAALDLGQAMQRVYVYASMRSDEDTRDQKRMEMNQAAQNLGVQFGSAVAWMRPEVLALGADKVKDFVARDTRLRPYAIYLDDIVRWAPHTLSAAEETIVARTGDMSGAGLDIREIFANAEFPYPEIALPGGERVRLDAQAYTRHRASPDRDERLAAFKAFFGALQSYSGTFGAALNAALRAHVFNKEVHRFDSSLQAATFPSNIPTKVYHQLIADVRAHLPTLHRYLKLRRRMMGLDVLGYEDLYAPIVKTVDLRFTPDEARDIALESVTPLGPDYVANLKKGFADRWVDWMPTTGKKAGAYSTGVYGVHPYQLQNFTGLYDEVSTLAHESGHSMHTFLSSRAQPFVSADYPTFIAEVASTVNEALLLDYMMKQTRDTDTRLFLLGSRLENLRQTLFRQTMFAEFELRIHEIAERGEPLTGERLTTLYRGMLKEYYGDAAGICKVDDLYGIEWAYVTHFFYNFYVYQYATSIVASSSLARGILAEAAAAKPKTTARDAYLAMLSAGSSKYAIDLLKDAGVDMTTSAPFGAAMAEMNRIMDDMEALLKK